ncbi:hypothetical protein E2C01_019031 [Portunus trituberculatus]|uniref:Uncharacterized protein n=1 Tax=Portunus trituberculatus TaxID=210409 RepID=A0A5B7DXY4_PORTR|nr:hypothetical protein [Portunus trituberculatus]
MHLRDDAQGLAHCPYRGVIGVFHSATKTLLHSEKRQYPSPREEADGLRALKIRCHSDIETVEIEHNSRIKLNL